MGVIRFILSIFHTIIIALLFGTMLNAYIPPKVFGGLNFLSLMFPVLMVINLVLLLYWMISWRKRTAVFLALSLFFIIPTRRWINYTSAKNEKPNLKVISLNAKFEFYGADQIRSFIKNENPDVVFFQEYEGMQLADGMHYAENRYPIVKIQSKYPIIESGLVKTDASNGTCIFADVEINQKRIRFIDVYMQPFFLEKKMVKPTKDLDKNEEKVKNLIHMLVPTFRTHQTQIEQIKTFADASPYPVIIGGDFNAVPNSYEYYKISAGLQDDFLKVGKGSGTSFHDYKFPLKIDHIFSSESIEPIRYNVDRSVKISDHFPVIASFYVK